jgi:hypothetical protein
MSYAVDSGFHGPLLHVTTQGHDHKEKSLLITRAKIVGHNQQRLNLLDCLEVTITPGLEWHPRASRSP